MFSLGAFLEPDPIKALCTQVFIPLGDGRILVLGGLLRVKRFANPLPNNSLALRGGWV